MYVCMYVCISVCTMKNIDFDIRGKFVSNSGNLTMNLTIYQTIIVRGL